MSTKDVMKGSLDLFSALFRTTKSRIQDMQMQFAMAEQQQEMYFANEQTMLKAIYEATDNVWQVKLKLHKKTHQGML